MFFFSLSWILFILGCFSCSFPPKKAGCHFRQKRGMQMNVTFHLPLHRHGGESVGLRLVPRRSRLGQSWTLPWAVTSPRDTRTLFPRLHADNGARENAWGLGWVGLTFTLTKTVKISGIDIGYHVYHQGAKNWESFLQPAIRAGWS